MFIRIKKIKKYEYAYLVANKWTKKGPRQKSKKYLGRCVRLEKKKDLNFKEYYRLDEEKIEKLVHSNSTKKVLGKLVEFELIKHGFEYDKIKKYYIKEDIIAMPNKLKIFNEENKNNLVLKINEGYLCEFLLRKILKFNFKGEDEDAYKFADLFVAAGLEVDKEVFVELFRKLTNQ